MRYKLISDVKYIMIVRRSDIAGYVSFCVFTFSVVD